jgi:hypothetical protein
MKEASLRLACFAVVLPKLGVWAGLNLSQQPNQALRAYWGKGEPRTSRGSPGHLDLYQDRHSPVRWSKIERDSGQTTRTIRNLFGLN